MGIRFLFNNEKGSILNISLLILISLTLIVIYLSRSSSTDVKIASNEKQKRIRFYNADSGSDIGSEILEQNIACPTGFTDPGGTQTIEGTFYVHDLNFRANSANPAEPIDDATRDVYFPALSTYGAAGSTSLKFGGYPKLAEGASLQMVAGYEGVGKSAASGGISLLFDVWSQHYGSNSAKAVVWIRWKHLVGKEDDCIY